MDRTQILKLHDIIRDLVHQKPTQNESYEPQKTKKDLSQNNDITRQDQ